MTQQGKLDSHTSRLPDDGGSFLKIELDDGKNLQESPINLMVKTHGFPVQIFP